MIISNRLSKACFFSKVSLYVCATMLLLVSGVSAGQGRFANNPGKGGFNPGGNIFGLQNFKYNQGNLKKGAQRNFGFNPGSGYSNSPVSVNPVGGNFGGGVATGGSPMSSGGSIQSNTGPANIGSGGFTGGLGNKGCMVSGPSSNNFGKNPGIGGKTGFVGGYKHNGYMMTKRGSDVIIKIPFDKSGKSCGDKSGAAFGCGDAFSELLDCKGGSFNKHVPTIPKGSKLNCNPHPKKCSDNIGWGQGKKDCGKKKWKENKNNCKNKKWRWKWRRHKKCKPNCHDDDTDADVDTDFDTDYDCDNDIDTDFDCDMDLDLDNDADDDVVVLVPAAPLWNEHSVEFEGCPALMNWMAAELGVSQEQLQIYIVNPKTAFRDINPCDMCARLQRAALILHDRQGIYLSALTEVLDEITSPGTPLSPEQIMLIAQRLAEPEPGSIYEQAAEYINAARNYVTILKDEIGYTADGSFTLAARYIGSIDNPDVADYVTAQLIELGL